MDALIFFLLLYIAVALAGVLGIFLLFFSKRIPTQKVAFYFIMLVVCFVIFLNTHRFSLHYFGHIVFTGFVIVLSLISFILERISKFPNRFIIAKYLVSLSVIVGIASLFLL